MMQRFLVDIGPRFARAQYLAFRRNFLSGTRS